MEEDILGLSEDVRYVAIYRHGRLTTRSRPGLGAPSAAESDKYEELLVNPTLITLASQRGNIDCGGLDFLVIRYGHFFQFVLPTGWGHVSVCFEPGADPIALGRRVAAVVRGGPATH